MAELALEMHNIRKEFPGIIALDDVSFSCHTGEIHALVGENGAGKSTLMKILAGVYQPDHGEIRLAGEAVRLNTPREAQRMGIGIIYQEFNLLPWLSVAEPKDTPTGNVSVSITPAIAEGAWLVTVIAYVKVAPTATGSSESALTMLREVGEVA